MPQDVNEREFERVMKAIPEGMEFLSHYRSGHWRVFKFRVTKPIKGLRLGDDFETSVARKYTQGGN